ncbi:hypothetical protein LI177_05200 [bacterium 210820-DFI.6.37]|nr:hypothetical protein [bacterium 210820-DFI.6.37]
MLEKIKNLNTLMQALIEKTKQKSAITVSKSEEQTLTTSSAKIVVGEVNANFGDAFAASGGGVLINKDCYIEVSGSVYISGGLTSKDNVKVEFWLNNTLNTTVSYEAAANGIMLIPVSPFVFKATRGDIIHLYAANNTGARGTIPAYYRTRLTVKEI